jgi:hypothetical protein
MRLDDPPSARLKVFIGLAIGTAVSAVAWLLLWRYFGWVLLVSVIGGKLIAVVGLARVPGWRPVAQGVLISIAVGAFIFFGKCASGFEQ